MPTSNEARLFGREMKRRREELGKTQADVGSASGLDTSAISKIEAGKREPLLGQAARIADALGTSVDALLGRGDHDDSATRGESVARARALMADGLRMLDRLLGQ